MEYLEKFLDGLEYVPPHLQQKFKVMYELDNKLMEVTKKIQLLTNNLLINNLKLSKSEQLGEFAKIEKLFTLGKEMCNDKVSIAENVYEMIDKQIRSLDTDLQQYKKKISRRIKGASDSKNDDIPSMEALTMALTDNKDEILDMPVDPNEPVYCLCHQVSFGEMVACDNKNCSIEWFHFTCVGLTSKPKGIWFCPNCR